jgi:hypothetical protein
MPARQQRLQRARDLQKRTRQQRWRDCAIGGSACAEHSDGEDDDISPSNGTQNERTPTTGDRQPAIRRTEEVSREEEEEEVEDETNGNAETRAAQQPDLRALNGGIDATAFTPSTSTISLRPLLGIPKGIELATRGGGRMCLYHPPKAAESARSHIIQHVLIRQVVAGLATEVWRYTGAGMGSSVEARGCMGNEAWHAATMTWTPYLVQLWSRGVQEEQHSHSIAESEHVYSAEHGSWRCRWQRPWRYGCRRMGDGGKVRRDKGR